MARERRRKYGEQELQCVAVQNPVYISSRAADNRKRILFPPYDALRKSAPDGVSIRGLSMTAVLQNECCKNLHAHSILVSSLT